ncbi:MAG: ribose-phosphate pyrophosphokinase [Malacoplasma sp.]|nr:ribose-phosphate pyrophosphokinase [Malacoplasma sp.]
MNFNDNFNNSIIFGLTNSNITAQKVAKLTGIEFGYIKTSKFADGEILVKSETTVRGKDIFLFQSTSYPVNDNLMELLIAIDSLKRASANSITIFVPYFGYARQDRKAKGREPITCKLVANFLETAGATKVILIDVHSEQSQGFFDIPVDTLTVSCVLLKELIKKEPSLVNNLTMVAPDYGAVKKVRKISEMLNANLAIVDKRRPKPNVVEISDVLGDVNNKNCLLIDDMIDTGETILQNIELLKKHNCKDIYVMATHGVFSNNAIEKFKYALDKGDIKELYISDTIEKNATIKHPKIFVVDLSTFYSEIILAQIGHNSVSDIYKKYWNFVCPK